MTQEITAIVFILYSLCLVAYYAVTFRKINAELPPLYRKVVNPPFPVTTAELAKEYAAIKNPVQATIFPFEMLDHTFKLLNAKYTGSNELDNLASHARKTIILTTCLMIIGFAIFLIIETVTA